MAIDFHKLLSPESRRRLDDFRKRQHEHTALDDIELIQRLEYSLANSNLTRYKPGDLVYDAVVVYIQLPEMLERFKERANYYEEIKKRHHFTCTERGCSRWCQKES